MLQQHQQTSKPTVVYEQRTAHYIPVNAAMLVVLSPVTGGDGYGPRMARRRALLGCGVAGAVSFVVVLLVGFGRPWGRRA